MQRSGTYSFKHMHHQDTGEGLRTRNRLVDCILCFLLASCTFWLWPDLAICLRKTSLTQLSAMVQTLTCNYPCANRWAPLPVTSDETGCAPPVPSWTPVFPCKIGWLMPLIRSQGAPYCKQTAILPGAKPQSQAHWKKLTPQKVKKSQELTPFTAIVLV